MATREHRPDGIRRRRADFSGLAAFFQEIGSKYGPEGVTFLCIGTDRSSGDALGPLTGTRLAQLGFPHVTGTLAAPCDANTLTDKLAEIAPGQVVVAIDACLGPPLAVGMYSVAEHPLRPARSVGREMPEVGHYSVAAIVNASGPKPYQTLQTTSLYRVMEMAEEIAAAASAGFGIGQ